MSESGEGVTIVSIEGLDLFIAQNQKLRDISFSVKKGQVLVVTGPSASGKSLLLDALFQKDPPISWRREGQVALPKDHGFSLKMNWLKQRIRPEPGSESPNWDGIFADPEALVILDEPILGLKEAENRKFQAFVKAQAAFGTVILVSHHQPLIEAVADEVLLLCDGRQVCFSDAKTFFQNPPNAMVEDFIRTGNCAFPEPLILPDHFRWILSGTLCGLGYPGLLSNLEDELLAVGKAGVKWLVSLTEKPFSQDDLVKFGMVGIHFPIPDMGVPSIKNMGRLTNWIQKKLDQGEVVGVHCKAGLGRTGLVLACQRVWQGLTAADAITEIRQKNNLYIQTAEQEAFVRRFEISVKQFRDNQ